MASGLLTDLYELTMAAGYFEAGRVSEQATFELSLRRLPRNRNFLLVAGLQQALDYLLSLRFTDSEIAYLQSLKQFERVPSHFFEYLRGFRFRGDVWAAPEGTVLFAGEPVMVVRANIIEAQIPETYLLAAITHQSLIATKASRIVTAAAGRSVVEFGTRRAHTAEAGVLGARAAYIAGCAGTSNTMAGFQYGIPVMGTAAHSWVMSFADESEAFAQMQRVLGPSTVHLVDTYDTIEGVRRAAALGPPLWGIRLDSGDFLELSKQARKILDSAGLGAASIMLSGDLDEHRIDELVSAGAPVDAFGVGTELATSADAPAMGAVYKLVEISGRATVKWSEGKRTWPGAKQILRFPGRDVVALAAEPRPPEACALLEHVVENGELRRALPSVQQARRQAAQSIEQLPQRWRQLDVVEPYPVEHSAALEDLNERTAPPGS